MMIVLHMLLLFFLLGLLHKVLLLIRMISLHMLLSCLLHKTLLLEHVWLPNGLASNLLLCFRLR
jgi:hypothetical protein